MQNTNTLTSNRGGYRDKALDLLKYVTIFMVVTGHTFQYLGYGLDCLDLFPIDIFTMIQMPQFMFISGFVSFKSLQNAPYKYLLETRWKSLLRPMIFYSLVIYTEAIIWGGNLSVLGPIKAYINSYWFIWAVIYSLIFMYVSIRILKLNSALTVLMAIATCLIPSKFIPIPHFSLFQAMLPFFLFGFYCKQYDILDKIYRKFNYIAPSALFIFFCCLYFYNGRNSFYFFREMAFIEMMKSFCFMLIAGTSGIILCYCLIKYSLTKLKNVDFAITAGQYTFAIYMMQGIVFNTLQHYNLNFREYWLCWIVAILIFGAINTLIKIVREAKLLSLLLLGKQ